MELETTIQELLARRSQRRLNSFRATTSRWKRSEQDASSRASATDDPLSQLEDAKAITLQRGFLREQLRMASLTALKRLHVLLQLIEMDDRDAMDSHVSSDAGSGGDNPQSPLLERSLAVIQRERACFDISFVASPTRVADLRETLFDGHADARRVCEALAFSSTRSGTTVRVVLSRVENNTGRVGSIRARSSHFMPDLQQQVDGLVAAPNGGMDDTVARKLLDSLWR